MIDAIREVLQRALSCFRRRSLDCEFEAEMAAHLEFAAEENRRSGMTAEEAKRRALVRFGGVQQSREQHREARGLPALDALLRDVRYALRTLGRDRGFTCIAVLMLGLAIGANVAVFSVVNGILLRPLPFRHPGQLVSIAPTEGVTGLTTLTYTADAYDQFRDRNHSFDDVAAYFPFAPPENWHLRGAGDPVPANGISVTGNFFQVLGVSPLLGRLFTREEYQRNGRPAVLLSYSFWRRQFGGDAAIVGKIIDLDGRAATVIGVLPESFDFGAIFSPGLSADMFAPAVMDDMREWGRVLLLFGRLKPGVSVAQANAEAKVLAPRLDFMAKYHLPDGRNIHIAGNFTMGVTPLREYVSGNLRRALAVLWCAVGLILLIVCVNLSNLLLARAGARSKEFAMRSAVGAGRARLIRQLLTESLVLSAAGALTGLGCAFGITTWLAHQTSFALPLLNTVRMDSAALVWTLFISVAAAVLFGVVPGFRTSGVDLLSSIKESGHGMSTGRKHQRLRATLVVSEIALACMLLVGAGLLLRSFLRVLDVDLGFEPARAAEIHMDYADGTPNQERTNVRREVIRRVDAIPGVEAAGITDGIPLESNRSLGLRARDQQVRQGEYPLAFAYVITPGYLQAMGMRLIEGRDFDWNDRVGSPFVVILNQTAARQLFPGQNPLDRIVLVGDRETRVVGIVPDVHELSPEGHPGPQMYLPAGPNTTIATVLVVRSRLPIDALEPSLMRVLKSINPTQPAYKLKPIQTTVDRVVSPRRFFMLLVTAFAALGLILAGFGIYGVVSYSVVRQTQEIGIRLALGASAGRVQAGVLRETFRLTIAGVAVGIAASIGASKLISALLFGTAPTDPVTFGAMVVLLGAAALLAGFLPAQRASHTDPMIALRAN